MCGSTFGSGCRHRRVALDQVDHRRSCHSLPSSIGGIRVGHVSGTLLILPVPIGWVWRAAAKVCWETAILGPSARNQGLGGPGAGEASPFYEDHRLGGVEGFNEARYRTPGTAPGSGSSSASICQRRAKTAQTWRVTCDVGPDRPRSIPACAGNPSRTGCPDSWYRVYPRVCGKPYRTCATVAGVQVYPRVCGETYAASATSSVATGLSPRVRGNLCVIMTHFRTNNVKDRRPMTIRRPCDESGALQLARPAALDDANPVRPCVPGSRRKGAYATRRRRAACRACGASAGAVRRDRPHVQSSRAFFRSQGGRLPTKKRSMLPPPTGRPMG